MNRVILFEFKVQKFKMLRHSLMLDYGRSAGGETAEHSDCIISMVMMHSWEGDRGITIISRNHLKRYMKALKHAEALFRLLCFSKWIRDVVLMWNPKQWTYELERKTLSISSSLNGGPEAIRHSSILNVFIATFILFLCSTHAHICYTQSITCVMRTLWSVPPVTSL